MSLGGRGLWAAWKEACGRAWRPIARYREALQAANERPANRVMAAYGLVTFTWVTWGLAGAVLVSDGALAGRTLGEVVYQGGFYALAEVWLLAAAYGAWQYERRGYDGLGEYERALRARREVAHSVPGREADGER